MFGVIQNPKIRHILPCCAFVPYNFYSALKLSMGNFLSALFAGKYIQARPLMKMISRISVMSWVFILNSGLSSEGKMPISPIVVQI